MIYDTKCCSKDEKSLQCTRKLTGMFSLEKTVEEKFFLSKVSKWCTFLFITPPPVY